MRRACWRSHYEALADRAFADSVHLKFTGQWLQRAAIAAGRDTYHHLLNRAFSQRIARTPFTPARQTDFSIRAARSRASDFHSPTAQGQRTGHVARTHRGAI